MTDECNDKKNVYRSYELCLNDQITGSNFLLDQGGSYLSSKFIQALSDMFGLLPYILDIVMPFPPTGVAIFNSKKVRKCNFLPTLVRNRNIHCLNAKLMN